MPNLTRIVNLVARIYKRAGCTEPVQRGRKAYSDLYVCQLVVVQHLTGYTNESSFLRHLARSRFTHFPRVPSQQQYNQRSKALAPLIARLASQVLKELAVNKTKIRVIDATGVPVAKLYRAGKTKSFSDKKHFGIGYCVAKKEYYFGQKLTIITNQNSIPVAYHLMAANKHDVKAVEGATRNLARVWLIGDKGYVGKKRADQLYEQRRIRVITPKRKNQKQRNTKWEKRKLKHRQIIERLNQQLKDHFGLEKLRAKSQTGIATRVRNIMFGYLMAIYFNKMYKRNPLSIKEILA